MTALLRAEVLKLRTTRTFLALTAAAVVTSVLLAGLVAVLTEPTADSVLLDVYNTDTSGLFILVLAVVGITGEWRHRTIAGSLLTAPDRARFLAAKTVAYTVAGLVLSAAVAVAVTAVSGTPPEDAGMGDEIDLLPAGLAVLGMLGWIAAAFAAGAALLRRRDVS